MVYKEIIYICVQAGRHFGVPGNTICEPRWSSRCTVGYGLND